MTVAEICETFNNKGYRTAKGSKFNKNSFASMFRNEKYVGIFRYKDIYIENGVPAIVSKELFNQVSKKLKRNAQAPARGKAKVDYLLTQKLYCGHCGILMQGDCGTSKTGAVHNYYTCGNRKRTHSCDKKSIQKDFIERAVVEDVLRLLTPEAIEELADKAIKQNQLDIESDTLIPALEQELHETEQGISNIIKMVEKGVQSDTLVNRLNELEKQKKDIEQRLIVAQDDIIILEREHVVWWLSKFCEGDINDEEFRRHIIDLLVNSVTVWDEPDGSFRITTVYNLTENNTETLMVTPSGKRSDLSGQLSPKRKSRVSGFFFLHFSLDV